MFLMYFVFSIFCSCNVLADRIWRLPTNVIPTSYQVKLHPDIDGDTYKGTVAITITIAEQVEKIALHSKNLTIENVTLDYNHVTHEIDDENQLLIVAHTNEKTIYAGEHIVSLNFQGSLLCGSWKRGFCKIPYFYENKVGYIVVSDSEATYARNTFPCFDEPALKAKFSVRIVTPNDTYIALSNMNNISKLVTPDGVIYDFATTRPLSTYNVVFIVTDYPYREKIWLGTDTPIPVRFYSPHNKAQLNLFPLDGALKLLDYFSNYTGIPYNLPKLDFIEYNRTTAASENWGMITVKDGMLSLNSLIFEKRQVILVIAHEIAHMWFGNLDKALTGITNDVLWVQDKNEATVLVLLEYTKASVTIDWWNDLWLKEGFAEFFGAKAVRALYKTELGGHIVRMIEAVMGAETFRNYIQQYLRRFSCKTVTTGRFLEAIEDYLPDISVRSFLEPWIYQNRYPILLVEDDDSGTTFRITQQSFSCHVESDTANSLQYKWTIPLTYITNSNFTPTLIWFDKDQDTVTLEVSNDTRWIMFNPSHDGLYRFNYTEKMIERLVDNIDELEQMHRNVLLLELYYLFFTGHSSCGPIMRYMSKYEIKAPAEDLSPVISLFTNMKIYLLKHNTELLPKFYEIAGDVAKRNHMQLSDRYRVLQPNDVWLNKSSLLEQPINKKNMPACIKWLKENL